ncbi:50S ribosomal protein L5 [Patescibacteria group bacterium]
MSTNNLKKHYLEKVLPQLKKKFGAKSAFAVPRLLKIVVNMGLGEASDDKKVIEENLPLLASITGQKPKVTKARLSISGFSLREGSPIGLMVTLRKEKMWSFLEKLIKIVLPRLRDFQGVSRKSFDGRGNYTLGVRELIVFPEVDYDQVSKVRGFEITIVTSADDNKQALMLLEALGLPFEKEIKKNG